VNLVATILILLAPVGLIYGWVFYSTRMKAEARSWRKRATLLSLILVSLVIVLWPVTMVVLVPRADWLSGAGVGHQVRWMEAWERGAFRALVVALVLGLFGRPRLILPIAVACVGTALFWSFSTIP
jgi:hypothetical protein